MGRGSIRPVLSQTSSDLDLNGKRFVKEPGAGDIGADRQHSKTVRAA
jgi:hypothetical protein